MKIGIPKGLYYYYVYDKLKYFFDYLNIELITNQNINKEIINNGINIANDEMCLSLKIFLGAVYDIKDKCDYILIPNINNYGSKDQMCCNFLNLYDLVDNLFSIRLLTYEIDYENNITELKGLILLGKQLNIKKNMIKKAYRYALNKYNLLNKKQIINNVNKLKSLNKKILLVAHKYNIYEDYLSKDIINYLNKNNIEIIYSDLFDSKETNSLSKYLSKDLYWKYSKENIGSIIKTQDNIDGIIFITTFPCGLDSLVNELVMRKINKPYLNLIIDDLDSNTGIETRLESFIDIIEQS